MMNLYEMTEQGRALYEMLTAEEIDEQTFTDTLEAIGAEQKLEAYAKVIQQLKADAEMLKVEKLRLADKQSRCEKAVERMKEAVTAYMKATGAEKTKAGVFSFSILRSASCIIDDATKIPADYVTYEAKVDKAGVKKAIQTGEEIPGAHIEINEGVTIK